MARDELVKRHVFVFNKKDNGGEALSLVTNFFSNGYGEFYTTQELTLNSYCNGATFNLCGTQLTSGILRELANQLDKVNQELSIKDQPAAQLDAPW